MFRKKPANRLRLAVLASGRGSNFEALWRAIQENKLSAEIVVLVSDQPSAKALESAATKGIPHNCIDFACYPDKVLYEQAVIDCIDNNRTDLVVLAGYMRLLGNNFVAKYHGRIVNIHPSLLPSFPGLHPQRQALDYGVKYSGCTIHFVDQGMDTGPIIMQAAVPVHEDDTEESLSVRILKAEHDSYWKAIQLIADNRISIQGRRVVVKK